MNVRTATITPGLSKGRLDALLESVNEGLTPAPKEIYDIQFINNSDYDVLLQSTGSLTAPASNTGILLLRGQTTPIDRLETQRVFLYAPDLLDLPAPEIQMIFKII